MRSVTSSGHGPLPLLPGETVLDALLRHGADVPFSCRGGTCQTCVRRCTAGTPPLRSQRGLDPALAARGYFLPCVCEPEHDLAFEAPDPADFVVACTVDAATHRDDGALLLRLEPHRVLTPALGDWFELALPEAAGDWRWEGEVVGLPQDEFFLTLGVPWPPAGAFASLASLAGAQEVRVRARPAAMPAPAAAGMPPPDAELWAWLQQGRLLRAILDDFYGRVFADPQLAPYFRGVTQDHVAGKQYAFLCKAITGEPVYFGDTPRNAHHWMVISDALFEHRQALMRRTQRDHGLGDEAMRRWERYERTWRGDIVKDKPFPKVLFGREFPLHGFGTETLTVGTLCDGCGEEVPAGSVVRFHLRTGSVNCRTCARLPLPQDAPEAGPAPHPAGPAAAA